MGQEKEDTVTVARTPIVADFETTTTPDDCRVWFWATATVSLTPEIDYCNDLDLFFKYVLSDPYDCYFHNLAFDGSFILNWLLRHDYTYVVEKPRPGQFTAVIDKSNKFYTITVNSRKGTVTRFLDSLKLIPMPVRAIPAAFGLDEMKGDIDYDAPRPVGYQPTDEEVDYIMHDVSIVARALCMQQSEGITKTTIGSSALSIYKEKMSQGLFAKLFPPLLDGVDKQLRKAYKGGFTYAAEKFRGKVVGPISTYDVNSLYPYVMYTRPLPYGEPTMRYGDLPDEGLWIARVVVQGSVKPEHIPCIQIKSSFRFSPTEYVTVIDEPVELWVTSVDWALWNDQYDLDVLEIGEVYVFDSASGIFTNYIDHYMEIKKKSTGGKRTIAKLMLNSLYGKFGTNPDATRKVPSLDDEGALKLRLGDQEEKATIYVPLAAFVTAWARDVTIRSAQSNFDTFAYADTDSMHLVGDGEPVGIRVDSAELGAWKLEGRWDDGLYAHAKCYTERLGDCFESHVAGMPADMADRVRYEHYLTDTVFHGKLVPRQVPGGVVLEKRDFTLKGVS